MTDAATKGFAVSKSVTESWKKWQKKLVKEYRHSGLADLNDLQQAYSLYVLALAGSPEIGAMNRLKESANLSEQAKWMLASAYALSGKKSIAKEMMTDVSTDISSYPENDRTFGSIPRDKALALEAYVLAGETAKALDVAGQVAELIDFCGYTTQTTAFASVALDRLSQTISDEGLQVEISQETTTSGKTAKSLYTCWLDADYG